MVTPAILPCTREAENVTLPQSESSLRAETMPLRSLAQCPGTERYHVLRAHCTGRKNRARLSCTCNVTLGR